MVAKSKVIATGEEWGDFLLQPKCSLLSTETAKCFLISFLLLAGLSLDSNIFHTFITEEEGIHDL
jgi:hypothetical protein